MCDKISLRARGGVGLALAFLMIVACMGVSHAQTKYPDKPVRIILPYGLAVSPM